MKHSAALRTVAVFEAAKGALVLVAGFGLIELAHADAAAVAGQLVSHLHLNPANRAPRIFLDLAASATSTRLWWLAAGAAFYAAVRFVEAFGLFRARAWAVWFGAATGAIYLPAELWELSRGITPLKLVILGINAAVLGLLVRQLPWWKSARA